MIEVTELLRALILEAMTLPREYDETGRDGRIVQLIRDSITPQQMRFLITPAGGEVLDANSY